MISNVNIVSSFRRYTHWLLPILLSNVLSNLTFSTLSINQCENKDMELDNDM